MGTIATLLVRLGVDAEDVDKGMSKAHQFVEKHGQKITDTAQKIGLAAGVALGAGLVTAMNAEQANDKLAAQLGMSGPMSEELGKVAGSLYAKGYGENVGEVNDAIGSVMRNISEAATASTADLEHISGGVLNLSKTFDQDLGGVTAAVGQMLRTGLAPDAQTALDILTVGFQMGNDKAGDLLDTVNEYGTQFRKVGLDGQAMMGLISQGLQAGARDADKVADAIKEFSIRAVDGSKASAAGFQALGLNAEKMTAQIAKGGPDAAAGLQTVLDRLRGMKDPVAQSQAAVALFGTQAEDLGAALLALDPSKAVQMIGDVGGAADKMGSTLSDNAGTKLETFKREALSTFADVAAKAVPALSSMVDWMGKHKDTMTGVIGALVAFAVIVGVVKGAMAVYNAMVIVVRAATIVWTAVQWLLNAALNANPIGLVILAIIALVAIIAILWTKCEGFREVVKAVFSAIWEAIKFVWDWLKENWPLLLAVLTGPIGLAVLWITKHWEDIKAGAGAAKDWIVARWNDIVDFVTSLPGKIARAASSMWDGIKDAFKSAINFVLRGWNGIHLSLPDIDLGPLGHVGGFTLRVPQVPLLAKGGDVTGTGLALVGERGPELLNLPRGASVAPLAAGAGGGGDIVIDATFTLDGQPLHRQLIRVAQQHKRRTGSTGLT